jgi:hypothetical protein
LRDQFLRRGRKLHGPAVVRASNHGRRRAGQIAGPQNGSWPAARLSASSEPAPAAPYPAFRAASQENGHGTASTGAEWIYYPDNIAVRLILRQLYQSTRKGTVDRLARLVGFARAKRIVQTCSEIHGHADSAGARGASYIVLSS